MKKKRIWILSHQSSDIQSIHKISSGLSELYLALPSSEFESQMILLGEAAAESELKKKLIEFKTKTPDHVVIVHPGITNHPFLKAMLCLISSSNPQFIFHIVGNFMRYGEIWFSLNHLLESKNVQFVAASKSYYDFLNHFVNKEHLDLLPFPGTSNLKKEAFSHETKKDGVIRILYAGRFHEQKNIDKLIVILEHFSQKNSTHVELSLAGYFDDFNPATIGKKTILGTQFSKFKNRSSQLSPFLKINLLPHQPKEKLEKLYRNNDIFMSLSTYFDEDFGYSVLEALEQGTPCLVSQWGGYKDFCRDFPEDCIGMEILIEDGKIILNSENFEEVLFKLLARTGPQRDQLSLRVKQLYSSETLQKKLPALFAKETIFKSFDPVLLAFSRQLKMESGPRVLEKILMYYKSFW